jgi:hypothetical protein
MDSDFGSVAERSLAATLGREPWIKEKFDDKWMEQRFYFAVDMLRERDLKAWWTYYETVLFLAKHPGARPSNTPVYRRFKQVFESILEECGINLFPF